MTIAVAQISAIGAINGTTGTSFDISLSGVTSGNTIIVCTSILATGSGGHVTSVNDGSGYTNAEQEAQVYSTTAYAVSSIDYLSAAVSGAHTIVVTNDNASFGLYGFGWAIEVSGLASSPVDKTSQNSNAGSNTASTGSTGTLSQAIELGIAVCSVSDSSSISLTEPSGFSNIGSVTNHSTYTSSQGSADYIITAATTALNANWGAGFPGTPPWSACIATFKASLAYSKLLLLS